MPDDQEQQPGRDLPSASRLWPDEHDGPWLIRFRFQAIGGRAECVGVEVTSARLPDTPAWMPGGKLPEQGIPITATLFRDMRIASLVIEVRETNVELMAMLNEHEEAAAFRAPPPTMRPATLKRLQRVADAYKAAWQRGQPPVKAVARRLKITDAAANGLVARARTAGLLPPTTQGRAAALAQDSPAERKEGKG